MKSYKQVLIVGSNHPTYVIEHIRDTWGASGLKEGEDFLVIGDGIRGVPAEEITRSLQGRTTATSHIHYWGHGNAKDGMHSIKIAGTFQLTTELLAQYGTYPGIFHVWSCQCGAAHEALERRMPGKDVILHSGSKHYTWMPMSSEVTAALGRWCQEFEDANSRLPTAEETFAYCMVSSPETQILVGWKDADGKVFKARAPKAAVGEGDLERYLESRLKEFYQCSHPGEASEKAASFAMPFLADAHKKRYLELALMVAAGRGIHNNQGRVEKYLKLGVDLNGTLKGGATPLHIACEEGHTDVVKALLEAGADVNRAKDNGTTPLYIACQEGHMEVVVRLLKAGADVNRTNDNGNTPLYIACQKGHMEVVAALLKAGADVNRTNDTGNTPLYIACQEAHMEVVAALLKAGADVNRANDNGTTPLYMACQIGHTAVVTALLAVDAGITLGMYYAFTPLMVAALAGKDDVVEVLLQHPQADIAYLQQRCEASKAEVFCKENNIPIPAGHRELFGKNAVHMAEESGNAVIAGKITARIEELQGQEKADGPTPLWSERVAPSVTETKGRTY